MPVSVFTLLNPLLAWGLAAIAAPILIHLLLRQRPRPRPWAAMRWLLAAMQAAQRRYKLTNLLLLILRCLALMLLALALARPSLAGFGRGGKLVLVIDTTASMGATAQGGGALSAVRQTLESIAIDHDSVALVTVDARVQVRATGTPEEIRTSAASLTATPVPGGLDAISDGDAFDLLMEACTEDSDVILVSDFRQDDGQRLSERLASRVRQVTRWRVGTDSSNAHVTAVTGSDDLVPGLPGSVGIELTGASEQAELAIGEGLPVPVTLQRSGDSARVALPPLDPGQHLLRLQLQDPGLSYDNLLELPILVRPSVPAQVREANPSRLEAALKADSRIEEDRIHPSEIGVALPKQGLVVARGAVRGTERLAEWVAAGGVLWTSLDELQANPELSALLPPGFAVDEAMRPGGVLGTGQSDLDASLQRISVDRLPTLTMPPSAEVLLAAGEDPLVITMPAGRGWVVVEVLPLAEIADLGNAGAFPLWVRRNVRMLTGRLHMPQQIQAGVISDQDLTLSREGREVRIAAGSPVMVEPGLWSNADNADLLVFPNQAEGRMQTVADSSVVTELRAALPQGRGADWGVGLLIAALAVLLLEGSLAAWAGRAYGR